MVVVVPAHSEESATTSLQQALSNLQEHFPELSVTSVVGGEERMDSLWQAVQAMESAWREASLEHSVVLVHDGARPFLTPPVLDRLLHQAHQLGGKMPWVLAPALPVRDTLRMRTTHDPNDSSFSEMATWQVVPRESFRLVQTPQVTRFLWLVRAFQQVLAGNRGRSAVSFTRRYSDETSLLQTELNARVHLIEGSFFLWKITDWEDWQWAQSLADRWKNQWFVPGGYSATQSGNFFSPEFRTL